MKLNALLSPTVGALLLAVSVGCVSLDPKSDPTRFYVLSTPAMATTASDDCARTVLVGPVRLASSADQPGVRERVSPTEVRFLEWHRWAEPLGQAMPRALITRLATQLPAACVLSFQRATPGTNTVQLEIDIDQFELTTANAAVLGARWRSFKPSNPADVIRGNATFTKSFEKGTNRVAAGVAAMSELIDQLTGRLAADAKGR